MPTEIPIAFNCVLVVVLALVQAYAWLGAPLLLGHGWVALTLALPLLLTLSSWALLHEAFHGLLHPRRSWNMALGRLLAVLFGVPYAVLREGHLLHHRFSRIHDLSETYDPALCPRWRANLGHFANILGGLYLGELLAALVVWLPRTVRNAATRRFAGDNEMTRCFAESIDVPAARWQARGDGLAIIALWSVAICLYGPALWMLLLTLALRGLVVSFFDNAYHYGSTGGNPRLARNHGLPRWAAAALLNFNHHGVHHRYPGTPWSRLPAQASRMHAQFDGGFFSGALRQLHGPIARSALTAGSTGTGPSLTMVPGGQESPITTN